MSFKRCKYLTISDKGKKAPEIMYKYTKSELLRWSNRPHQANHTRQTTPTDHINQVCSLIMVVLLSFFGNDHTDNKPHRQTSTDTDFALCTW